MCCTKWGLGQQNGLTVSDSIVYCFCRTCLYIFEFVIENLLWIVELDTRTPPEPPTDEQQSKVRCFFFQSILHCFESMICNGFSSHVNQRNAFHCCMTDLPHIWFRNACGLCIIWSGHTTSRVGIAIRFANQNKTSMADVAVTKRKRACDRTLHVK